MTLEALRQLIVVLALSMAGFYVARLLADPDIAPREFRVWRNAWFATVVIAFLTNSFLIFAAFVPIICLYARANKAATLGLFFILMLAVPLGSSQLSGFGLIQTFFELTNSRLLTIILLLPILVGARRLGPPNRFHVTPDWLIVGFVLLTVALSFERYSTTQTMRFAAIQGLDVLIPYFAFSRASHSLAEIRKILLAFCVALLPLSLIAIFEMIKGWHLYAPIIDNWGSGVEYLRRGGLLRASASSSEPIALGFVIMVGIGCLLASSKTVAQKRVVVLAFGILIAGLVASLSRGPWVGAGMLILCYLAIGPKPVANVGKASVAAGLILLAVLLTPFGERLMDLLPFVGPVDQATVTYRETLINNAVPIIEQHLWFGSDDYVSTPELKELKQGEGIVDVVNTYLGIALSYGVVGLGMFLSFFGVIVVKLWNLAKSRRHNSQVHCYGRGLLATLLAILVTIGTASSVDFIPHVYWALAGLCVGLLRVAQSQDAATKNLVTVSRYTSRTAIGPALPSGDQASLCSE